MIRIVKTDQTAYNGQPKHAVYDGERLLGHVHKDERTNHVMAHDKGYNYSVGTRVRHGWQFDLTNLHARVRVLDMIADKERFRRLGRGFRQTRKDAVAEIVAVSAKLDELVSWAERSRG